MTTQPSSTPASGTPLISVDDVSKAFGSVKALSDVSIDFRAGEIHGLVGANGAGKSTLLNLIGGVIQPDSGTIRVAGEPVAIDGTRTARELGFAFMYQELALIPEFSAIDNMTLSLKPTTPFGMGDKRKRRAAAREVAERLRLTFDLDRPVKDLPIAERGLVAIGRALVGDARFVAMDEPTASLSDVECERLFTIVRELAADGVAVAYVSHRLDEIDNLCDQVTIFKDGRTVNRYSRGGYTREDLLLGITGARTLSEARPELPEDLTASRVPLLEVSHLAREPRVHDVSFTLHKGEILGLAGVVGAGRTEVARMIFGADRPGAGSMTFEGRDYHPKSTVTAITRGIALVPEERRSQALVMEDPVVGNITMGAWKTVRSIPWLPFISDKAADRRAREMGQRLSIKMRDEKVPVRTLSGGNQQKVVFGRWLARSTKVMLLDEPTRGVDVGARRQIWQTVEDFVAAGGSAVVICSELQELSLCHRVVVLVEGRTVAELEGPGVTESEILETIYAQDQSGR